MKIIRNLAIAIVVPVFVSVGGLWTAQQIAFARFVIPTFEALNADAARIIDTWLEDTQKLDDHRVFRAERPDKDASAYLNPLVPWTGNGDVGKWAKGSASLALPDEVGRLLTGFPKTLPDEAALTAISTQLDYRWMRALDQYGYWELSAHAPRAESPDRVAWLALSPRYAVLLDWSKLRLWQARQAGQLRAAVAEVMQLGWLTLSTETMAGAMSAVAIFDAVDEAARQWSAGELAPLFSREDLDRLRRTFWAGPGLIGAPIEAETVKRALSAPGLPVCVALNEMARLESLLWPQSLSTFADRTPHIIEALRQPPSGCRLVAARALYAEHGARERPLSETLGRSGDAIQLEFEEIERLAWAIELVPGAESTFIKLLSASATPGAVSRYDEEPHLLERHRRP